MESETNGMLFFRQREKGSNILYIILMCPLYKRGKKKKKLGLDFKVIIKIFLKGIFIS